MEVATVEAVLESR